ncbi:hypothetical protein KAR91_10320, partial [Candidatus Pacearchaeota archaeon]|nr:hypothetical protein [Candidatus Pacearchaeota archaeon]
GGCGKFDIKVEFGCFVQRVGKEDSAAYRVELLRERQGLPDVVMESIVCPICGCCRWLQFTNPDVKKWMKNQCEK